VHALRPRGGAQRTAQPANHGHTNTQPHPNPTLDQGNVTISNDGATIMKKLDVVHPAAKALVDVSLSQDAEVRGGVWGRLWLWLCCKTHVAWAACLVGGVVGCRPPLCFVAPKTTNKPPSTPKKTKNHQNTKVGDGTTTVVVLSGELLREAKPYVEEGVHPRVRA
jgi:hypothetical protein